MPFSDRKKLFSVLYILIKHILIGCLTKDQEVAIYALWQKSNTLKHLKHKSDVFKNTKNIKLCRKIPDYFGKHQNMSVKNSKDVIWYFS